MTEDADSFRSRVVSSDGTWPSEPTWMSYSSLREIESCPRRWMLRRAHYPGLSDKPGYPELPSLPTFLGNVMHSSIEHLIRAFARGGCDATDSVCAVRVLKDLGGYTAIITSIAEKRLSELESNPRAVPRLPALRDATKLRLAETRQRVQAAVSRTQLVSSGASTQPSHLEQDSRGPLQVGSYPEVELRAPMMKWLGRADLITLQEGSCEITDFKTGSQAGSHAEQLQTYALLWSRDSDRNPAGALPTRLVLRYPATDRVVPVPSVPELENLERLLGERTVAVRAALSARPPEARPAVDVCDGCPVRHLCEEYWHFLRNSPNLEAQTGPTEVEFGDVQLQITKRNGARSWIAVGTGGRGTEGADVLVRTQSESMVFQEGSTVRFLNVALTREGGSALVAAVTSNSEVFALTTSV